MANRIVTVMVTEYGRQNMSNVIKYFENDVLTVTRRYTAGGLINPLTLVTMLDIVSGNDLFTLLLVKIALVQLNEELPGAAMLHSTGAEKVDHTEVGHTE